MSLKSVSITSFPISDFRFPISDCLAILLALPIGNRQCFSLVTQCHQRIHFRRTSVSAGAKLLVVNEYQLSRIFERERPQEISIDNRKHCGIGADPKRERDDCNRGEPRLFQQVPYPVTKFLDHFLSDQSINDRHLSQD